MTVSNEIEMRVLSVKDGQVSLEFTLRLDGDTQVVRTENRLKVGDVVDLLGSRPRSFAPPDGQGVGR